MKILVHSCCGDCVLKWLKSYKGKGEVSLFFYNPNIQPRAEYQSRLVAIKLLAQKYKWKLVIPDWSPREYFEVVKNDKNRCESCWKLRLETTLGRAKRDGFEQVSSTLLVSKYQNKKTIEKIGKNLAKKYKIKFLVPKKIVTELPTSGFYKQFFCGCVYSLKGRMEEKYNFRN